MTSPNHPAKGCSALRIYAAGMKSMRTLVGGGSPYRDREMSELEMKVQMSWQRMDQHVRQMLDDRHEEIAKAVTEAIEKEIDVPAWIESIQKQAKDTFNWQLRGRVSQLVEQHFKSKILKEVDEKLAEVFTVAGPEHYPKSDGAK